MTTMSFSCHTSRKILKQTIPRVYVFYTFKQWNPKQYWANMSLFYSKNACRILDWIVFIWIITTAIEVRDRRCIYCEAGVPVGQEEVDEVPDVPGHLHVLWEAKAVLVVHDLPVGPHQGLGVEGGLTCSQGPTTLTLHSCLQITQAGLNHVRHKSGKHKDDCSGKSYK